MFYVYALKSINHEFTYVGMTENLQARINRHNRRYNPSTKHYAPYKLIYSETCETGSEARAREKYLKSPAGKKFLSTKI